MVEILFHSNLLHNEPPDVDESHYKILTDLENTDEHSCSISRSLISSTIALMYETISQY